MTGTNKLFDIVISVGPNDKDIVSKMIKTLKEDTNIVGVHPGNKKMNKEEVFFIKNIFSCYRATWFNNVGRFQKN